MASTNEVLAIANAGQKLADELKAWVNRANQFLSNNSAHAIAWNTVEADVPGSVTEGNITGLEFSPDDLSNLIGSVATIRDVIVPTHIGNVEKLAKPLV